MLDNTPITAIKAQYKKAINFIANDMLSTLKRWEVSEEAQEKILEIMLEDQKNQLIQVNLEIYLRKSNKWKRN